jgi:pimeloyl-ACP methyl ester carboxylesterase
MPAPGTQPGIASLTQLVSRFLDSLGLEQPHLAGNSLGGWISLELAKQGRARSATGLSPAGFHNDRERRFQHASLTFTRRACRLIAPYADRLTRARWGRVAIGAQAFAKPANIPPGAFADTIRGFAGAPWFDDTLDTITANEHFSGGEEMTVPVTIAWGEKDRLLLPRQARRAQAAIPSARVITLRGCGHVPMYDDPEQVATVLLEGSARPVATGR